MIVTMNDVQAAIEKLGKGQALKYQLVETFGGDIACIELNESGKGGKYVLSFEPRADFKPDGKRSGSKREFIKHSSAKFLARWITQRFGNDEIPP